ncbi:NfeD family protein [Planctomycetota bacterium]
MSPVVIAILYVVGVALVLFELVTPGLVVGLIGVGCLGTAVYFTFQYGMLMGLAALGGVLTFSVAVALFAVRRLTVRGRQKKSAGYQSADPTLVDLIGKEGVTLTPLHPSGYCRLEGRRVGVVSRGDPIDADVHVKVIDVEGVRVVVKPT